MKWFIRLYITIKGKILTLKLSLMMESNKTHLNEHIQLLYQLIKLQLINEIFAQFQSKEVKNIIVLRIKKWHCRNTSYTVKHFFTRSGDRILDFGSLTQKVGNSNWTFSKEMPFFSYQNPFEIFRFSLRLKYSP